MNIPTDVTIAGGGILGLLTARECALAGASVTLVEKGAIGQESSWAGGGILLPLYPWRQPEAISHLVLHSLTLYPNLVQALHNDTGIDPECVKSGIFISKNPDLLAAKAWCTQHAIRCDVPPAELDAINTTRLNPLWLPDIHQVRNPRLLQALESDVKRLGVQIQRHTELLNVTVRNAQVTSLLTSQGSYPVNALILTTGAWTSILWQRLFSAYSTLPAPVIHPVKGQMLLFDTPPETLTTMILDDAQYLIPRKDGKILVGSTVEPGGFDKSTDSATRSALTHFAQSVYPALQDYPVIKHWAGIRPGTELGIPYITRHPELTNVCLNAGHFRNGLAMAPASAQLVVDLLLNRPMRLSAEPYQFYSAH